MAFMRKEESSYNYKLELEDDDDNDKSLNKTSERMLQLGVVTASNWVGNISKLMFWKNRSATTKHKVSSNETPDPSTPSSHTSNPTKTIGNKAIEANVVFDRKNGEYVLTLTTVETGSTTAVEQAKTAAILLSQAELLRQLGQKLLIQPEFFKSLDI